MEKIHKGLFFYVHIAHFDWLMFISIPTNAHSSSIKLIL